jgi:energy-coupling factor transport system permease protein
VPIFATEFHDIQDAQKARGVDFDTKNIIRKIGLIAPLCVPLLVSSLKKVDVSAMSAEMRGFELRGYKSGYKEYPFAARDLVTIVVLVAIIVATVIFNTIW